MKSDNILIGIIGEDPYDTAAIKNLLSQKYSHRFKPILKQIKGDQLYSRKTLKLLKIELKHTHYPIIIYIKDLDGLESEKGKRERIFNWFNTLNSVNNNSGMLLLNIYELEALILSDIETFNKTFGTRLTFTGNPMLIEEPKEYLKRQTRKCKRQYDVSDNPALFKKLSIEKLIEKCRYFKEFISDFDSKTTHSH